MLQILMGPNVEILMGQSFGSWTHGHGPMAWAQGLALAAAGEVCGTRGGGRAGAQGQGPWAQGHGPMPMCPGAKALAHEYFDIWAHKYF